MLGTLELWEYIGAVVVALMIFADWILGEDKRQQMRERVGEWWLHLEESGITALLARSAHASLEALGRVVGKRVFLIRFFITTWLISAAISLGPIFVGYSDGPLISGLRLAAFGALAVIPGLIGFASWAITIALLRIIARSHALGIIVLVLLIDAIAAAALQWMIGLQWLLGAIALADTTISLQGFFERSWRGLAAPFNVFLSDVDASLVSRIEVALIHVGALLPTLVHFCFALTLCVAKFGEPVFRPCVGVVLLRLHESRKGILTILALGVAGAVALIHRGMQLM